MSNSETQVTLGILETERKQTNKQTKQYGKRRRWVTIKKKYNTITDESNKHLDKIIKLTEIIYSLFPLWAITPLKRRFYGGR